MDTIRELVNRIRAVFRKSELDRNLNEEMQVHLEMAVEENAKRA